MATLMATYGPASNTCRTDTPWQPYGCVGRPGGFGHGTDWAGLGCSAVDDDQGFQGVRSSDTDFGVRGLDQIIRVPLAATAGLGMVGREQSP